MADSRPELDALRQRLARLGVSLMAEQGSPAALQVVWGAPSSWEALSKHLCWLLCVLLLRLPKHLAAYPQQKRLQNRGCTQEGTSSARTRIDWEER
jgi:hypothetical protein